jgi:alpha-tubulin suppressor-like RCC1 family protein
MTATGPRMCRRCGATSRLGAVMALVAGVLASVLLAAGTTGWAPSAAAPLEAATSSTVSLQSVPEWANGDVTDVVAGGRVSCALRQGSVYCWGRVSNGLGNGGMTSAVPVPISATNGFQNSAVTHITAGVSTGGADHLCAIENQRLFCWGNGATGQMGNGTTTRDNFVPVPVSPVAGGFQNATVSAVTAGGYHTCAIEEQRVYCWGRGLNGQLGDNFLQQRNLAVPVAAQNGFQNASVSAVMAGQSHTCAIEEQRLFCWGSNSTGALGDGTNTQRSVPVPVLAANGFQNASVSAVATGKFLDAGGNKSNTCALENGTVWCWGRNAFGQLGIGTTLDRNTPITVSAVPGGFANTHVTTISAGTHHTCGIENTGSGAVTYCWGLGASGRLGTGLTSNSTLATVSAGFDGATHVSAGEIHTCGIKAGMAWCWGEGSFSSLGNGSTANRLTPTLVSVGSACSGLTGAGTPASPFIIATAADLALVSGIIDCYSKHFKQTADIDLYNASPTGPIGGVSPAFTGSYDGDGHTISNLTMDDESGQGLFGRTDGATITNITLSATTITVTNSAGALIAHAVDTTVSGVNLFGVTVSAQQDDNGNSNVGALIGIAENTTITDITVTDATIIGGGGNVGGLVGHLIADDGGSSVSDVRVDGLVDGGGSGIGGLIGWAEASTSAATLIVLRITTDTTVSANPSAGGGVGGLIGIVNALDGSVTVSASLVVGATQGHEGVGGLVGDLFGGAGGQVVLIQSLVIGSVTGSAWVGGLIGVVSGSGSVDASSSLWDTSTTGQATSAGHGVGASTTDLTSLMRIYVLAGWDIKPGSASEGTITWGFCPGVYPFLLAQTTTICLYAGDPVVDRDSGGGGGGLPIGLDDLVTQPVPTPRPTPASTVPLSPQRPVLRPVTPPAPGTNPSLVRADDGERLRQQPGMGSVRVDGVPQVANVIVGDTQTLVDEIIDGVRGDAVPPVSIVDTPAGAMVRGVLVDPRDGVTPIAVPVEHVVMVMAGDLRVLLVAADANGAPAPVAGNVLEVTNGGVVSALAYGLPANAAGELVVFSNPVLLGTFTTRGDGSFNGQFTVPPGLEPGEHTLVLAASGVTASLGLLVRDQQAVDPGVLVDPAAPMPGADALPATGRDPRIAVLLATFMLFIGALAVTRWPRASRRSNTGRRSVMRWPAPVSPS